MMTKDLATAFRGQIGIGWYRFAVQVSTFALVAFLVAGCAIKRDRYDTPEVPLPAHYLRDTVAVEGQAPKDEGVSPLDGWWRLFGSDELNALVDRALANNSDLRIAAQRVLQARARARQARAEELPEVSLPLRYEVEAPEDGVGTARRGQDLDSEETYQGSLRADWRVDLWGEQRSLTEAAKLDLWKAIFEYDDQARNLVAEIVGAYAEYLTLNDRMRVAMETEAVLYDMLEAMETRLQSGDATLIDVEQQRTAVHGVRADMPAIELRRRQVAHRLAELVGGVPEDLVLTDLGLDALARPSVKPGIPSALLLLRPDVRAVEARLLAADASIDVARARVLPPLDLTGQVGYGSQYFDELFMPHTVFWSFIANLSATIFDAGRRKREVDYSRAAHEELVETYVRVIHRATAEVENALAAVEQTEQRLMIQQEATDAARRAWMYSEATYTVGAIDYLVYLDTVRTFYRNLENLHNFRRDTYQGQVDLFRSLGGGAPNRALLPGEGRRPAIDISSVIVGESRPMYAQGHWLPSGGWGAEWLNRPEVVWLVEITGIHSRDGVAATWRDLRNRYTDLVDGQVLVARLPADTVKPEGVAATWYRLAVGDFSSKEKAQTWCQAVRDRLTRCEVVELERERPVEGRFPWPDPLEQGLARVRVSPETAFIRPGSIVAAGAG